MKLLPSHCCIGNLECLAAVDENYFVTKSDNGICRGIHDRSYSGLSWQQLEIDYSSSIVIGHKGWSYGMKENSSIYKYRISLSEGGSKDDEHI